MSSNIIVVGGGPAGFAAGIFALRTLNAQGSETRSVSVTILERNTIPGRKLLLAGSGQCNLTHTGTLDEFLEHYGSAGAAETAKRKRFIKPCLNAWDNHATIRFFEELGVPLGERNDGRQNDHRDGKIFPKSLKSRDILHALTQEFWRLGGKMATETLVTAISRTEKEFVYDTVSVKTAFAKQRETRCCAALILAAGGSSFPVTGSDGTGFRLAKQLGHSLSEPRPALVPIIVSDYRFADCAGASIKRAEITVWRGGRKVATNQGDVLLTHHGLSGPGMLDLSRSIFPGDHIRVALSFNAAALPTLLFGKKTLRVALKSLGIPDRILARVLTILSIRPEMPACEVPRSARIALQNALSGWEFLVQKRGGWKEAMVTAGGVTQREVNRLTMESRLVPKLYFAGEILDVDGDTGGYNIQFALSSGRLAGDSAAKALLES